MKNNQKVSIITPLYNSEKYISQTIESVLNQTYQNWEMIIIDDYSQDGSANIVESFGDLRIQLIRLKENKGAGIARNKGLDAASGRYIAFLDSDDLWVPDKLEKQLAFMQSKNLGFCYSSFYLMDDRGNSLKKYRLALPKVNYTIMLKNNYIGCLTAVYDTNVLGKIYMTAHKKRQDWGLWLKILSKIPFAESIEEPLAFYRLGNESLSQYKLNLIRHNYLFYKDQLGFSSIESISRIILFLFYYFHYKINFTKAV